MKTVKLMLVLSGLLIVVGIAVGAWAWWTAGEDEWGVP